MDPGEKMLRNCPQNLQIAIYRLMGSDKNLKEIVRRIFKFIYRLMGSGEESLRNCPQELQIAILTNGIC